MAASAREEETEGRGARNPGRAESDTTKFPDPTTLHHSTLSFFVRQCTTIHVPESPTRHQRAKWRVAVIAECNKASANCTEGEWRRVPLPHLAPEEQRPGATASQLDLRWAK
jgi:hypothetical protein